MQASKGRRSSAGREGGPLGTGCGAHRDLRSSRPGMSRSLRSARPVRWASSHAEQCGLWHQRPLEGP